MKKIDRARPVWLCFAVYGALRWGSNLTRQCAVRTATLPAFGEGKDNL